jgi:mono/diheme cytochrome c family protein
MIARSAALLFAAGVMLGACGQDEKPTSTSSAPAAPAAPGAPAGSATASVAGAGDAAKGKQVWLSQCVACHNADPGKDGPIGPAVRGSSRDLLDARVVHGTYPAGYTPKRDSKVMPPRPDLVASVPDLAAYLR